MPAEDNEVRRRSAFLSEALRPSSTTAQWASFASAEKKTDGGPVPGLALIEAETINDEAAAIALILREALETKGQTAALVTPDETLIGRVWHALTSWGLPQIPSRISNPDSFGLARRYHRREWQAGELCRASGCFTGDEAASIRRFAELIDLGVLRQMWRPSSMADVPAALARAQHAIAAGEARHPAMKRIETAEWEAARAFAERVLDALSLFTSKAAEPLTFREWTTAIHSAVLARLAELGIGALTSEDSEPSTLADASKVHARSLSFDIAGYAGFFGGIATMRAKPAAEHPHPRLFLWRPLDARLLAADVIVLGGLNEGSWPKIGGPSPWLNRKDRAFVGLSRRSAASAWPPETSPRSPPSRPAPSSRAPRR